jgi:hypothetical protein
MIRTDLRLPGLTLAIFILAEGCATKEKTVALGGGIGATGGAVLGSIADPGRNGEFRTRNVVVGAALGAMTGLIAGSVIGDRQEQERKKGFEEGKSAAPTPGEPPKIKNAVVETLWIKGHRSGNRFVEGHFEYVIREPARWEDDQ